MRLQTIVFLELLLINLPMYSVHIQMFAFQSFENIMIQNFHIIMSESHSIRIKAIRPNPLQLSEDQNKTNKFYAQRLSNQTYPNAQSR
jgi:hypothetical protein